MKVINPNAPDEYKYTSDYREIPREYLNPNIPQGRGIVKWAAFKTLPEQYEQLEQYIQDQNKIDKPILSDDQLSELNDTLVFKMFHDPVITVSYYEDGYIKNIEGYIHKVDNYERLLYLYEETILRKVNLKDIVEIK
ncbi:YolD-like family protein [Staphylococcus nepalensis]|uniref:YolD-like family protein n=1 Tax=Staphylococcus nepalensis TaxID=214473 RepID=UPI001E2DE604|nr:YolD-like family protein [Staphylococcus nepalensis]MCD8891017.1 YolD-like family protein [Staphylococcus nepalensis]